MRAYERMLNYIKIWTTSDSSSESVPSTSRQFDLAKLLVEEMKKLGIEDAHVDDKCYVYGTLPAKKGYEDKTKLGFIAPVNFVFLVVIGFLLIENFMNNLKISMLNEKVKNLNHYIALKEYEK